MTAPETVRWARFALGARDAAEVVEITDGQAHELRRFDFGHLVSVDGQVVHFSVRGAGVETHYVRLAPSGELGRAERDRLLGPQLGHLIAPQRPASPIAARLREIADAVEMVEIPAGLFPGVLVSFQEVASGAAHALTDALAGAHHDTSTEAGPGRVCATWYGNREVPPVRFTFWYPEPPDTVICEQCGGADPRETFDHGDEQSVHVTGPAVDVLIGSAQ